MYVCASVWLCGRVYIYITSSPPSWYSPRWEKISQRRRRDHVQVWLLKVTGVTDFEFQRNTVSSYPKSESIKHLASLQEQKHAPKDLEDEVAVFMTCIGVFIQVLWMHIIEVFIVQTVTLRCVSIVCAVYWHAGLNEALYWRMRKFENCTMT